jgi:hypothetical protein
LLIALLVVVAVVLGPLILRWILGHVDGSRGDTTSALATGGITLLTAEPTAALAADAPEAAHETRLDSLFDTLATGGIALVTNPPKREDAAPAEVS